MHDKINPAGDSAPALHRRRHLRRLERIFGEYRSPMYSLTICVADRRRVLAFPDAAAVLRAAWRDAASIHGWAVGRYVVMPDHVHFFAAPCADGAKNLSGFVGAWKNYTQRLLRTSLLPSFHWQREFFDHLLRSDESYDQKWQYVLHNPVRAGLVSETDDWPYQGEICPLA